MDISAKIIDVQDWQSHWIGNIIDCIDADETGGAWPACTYRVAVGGETHDIPGWLFVGPIDARAHGGDIDEWVAQGYDGAMYGHPVVTRSGNEIIISPAPGVNGDSVAVEIPDGEDADDIAWDVDQAIKDADIIPDITGWDEAAEAAIAANPARLAFCGTLREVVVARSDTGETRRWDKVAATVYGQQMEAWVGGVGSDKTPDTAAPGGNHDPEPWGDDEVLGRVDIDPHRGWEADSRVAAILADAMRDQIGDEWDVTVVASGEVAIAPVGAEWRERAEQYVLTPEQVNGILRGDDAPLDEAREFLALYLAEADD